MHPQIQRAVTAVRRRAETGPVAQHVLATYGTLRKGLVFLAFLMPLALVGVGTGLFRMPVQQSLSAYYFAPLQHGDCVTFPLRALFAGFLCAICAGLYLYKGFTKWENWLLNAAGLFGLGVALIPKGVDDGLLQACTVLELVREHQGQLPTLHAACAFLMFACLALVAWTCAGKTLAYLPEPHRYRASVFKNRYRGIGICMALIAPLTLLLNQWQWPYTVLAGEWAGIWIFAWYWAVKTQELALSDAEDRAVRHEAPPAESAASNS